MPCLFLSFLVYHVISAEKCDPSQWNVPDWDSNWHYNTTSSVHSSPDVLNVHLIPHSHDDPGWRVTVDDYYTTAIQYILDTVIEDLQQDKHRRFMFVEQAFFQRWWGQQNIKTRNIVNELITNGQFDLSVNGGWVMHDEATPHYTGNE